MLKKILSYEPHCPFCDQPFERPKNIEPTYLGEFEKGICICDAYYIHDVTGHNLGSAFLELLSFITHNNWELVWQLQPDEDYQEARLENYDINSHLIQPTGRDEEGRRIRGVLIFIKLRENLSELTRQKSQIEFLAPKTATKYTPKRYSKQEIDRALKLYDLELLTEMAIRDKVVLKKLRQRLFTPDPIERQKVSILIGQLAKEVIKYHPEMVGELVRGLMLSLQDSASSSWGAVETVCEVIRNIPKIYSLYVNKILTLLKLQPELVKSILYGIGRINETSPELITRSAFYPIYDLLMHEDPEIRGLAVYALGRHVSKARSETLEALKNDENTFEFFDGEGIIKYSVSDMIKKVMYGVDMENRVEDPNLQKKREAIRLYEEGVISFNRGMTLDAIKHLEKSRELFEELEDEVGIANCSERIGDSMLVRGNFHGALSQYKRALAICEKFNDHVGSVILAEKIIEISRKNRDYDTILNYCFFVLEKLEFLGDSGRAAMILATIGDTYERQGRIEDALDAYKLAHKIFKGMGSRERAQILEDGIKILEARLQG